DNLGAAGRHAADVLCGRCFERIHLELHAGCGARAHPARAVVSQGHTRDPAAEMGALAAMTLLTTIGLSRHFGGVRAVDAVDFSLAGGEIRAVIGPNGAGKTTLVSMICGRVPVSDGRILFEGADITRMKPWRRVEHGIVYTFQITSVFQNLTCFDNVALAVQ